MKLSFTVEKESDIKSFLIEKGFSNKQIGKLLLFKKNLFINGKVYEVDYSLHKGDKLCVLIEEQKSNILPINKPIDIIYEDEYFLVVNKPKGIATIPSKLHYLDNLAGRVLFYFNENNIDSGIHIINRLDYLTCGIVVFAKSSFIHQQMSNVKITKKYKAKICGILDDKSGEINKKISKSNDGIKRIVSENGKTAITKYNIIEEKDGNSTVDISLLTGRTHQIRVHFAYISHPLLGDTLYNKNAKDDKDFYLSSYQISFIFPLTNRRYMFSI